MSDAAVSEVDRLLPAPRLVALGLTADQRAILINADILACGLASLVQSIGLPGVGIRLPVMMGVTFASVAPMLAMIQAAKDSTGAGFSPVSALTSIYGAVMAAGVFAIIVAPFMSRLLRLFPPVVTGSIILVIGLSLMRIGVGWVEGPFTIVQVVDGAAKVAPNPNRDALDGFALSLLVLLVILGVTKFGKGFWANIAVLIGIVIGAVVAAGIGKMDLSSVAKASWAARRSPSNSAFPISRSFLSSPCAW